MRPIIVAPSDLLPWLDVPRTPQQRRSHAKRERLLAAAESVFEESGYTRATVDAITARAHVSTGTFYSYFRDKRQLLVLLVGEQLDALAEPLSLLDLRTHPGAALERLVREVVELERGSGRVWRTWTEALTQDDELADYNRKMTAWVGATLLHALDRVGAEGGLRPDLDRMVTARLITALLCGAVLEPVDDSEPVIHATTSMIYHTLFTDHATN